MALTKKHTGVGLLSTASNPTLGRQVTLLERRGIHPLVLIDDGKDLPPKMLRVLHDRTNGRIDDGMKLNPTYPHNHFPSHNSTELIEFVKDYDLALLVNCGTQRILSKDTLEAAHLGVLNVHPGLLPKYRGCCCTEWAILDGNPVGVSAHFMDTGIDTGPILATRVVPYPKGTPYEDIRMRVYFTCHEMVAEVAEWIVRDSIHPSMLKSQGVFDGENHPPIPDGLMHDVRRLCVS
jgi:folate-dependent phosphoribosylglycinamide formyltransferase PurN